MDHATGENLFMIDFRRYLYQFTTVELTGTKLAHQTRAAVVRGIS
jgi:hypothetical protein